MRALAITAFAFVLSGPMLATDARHSAAAACELVGHWVGHLEHRGRQYPIRLDISCEGGRYGVTLDLPEYLVYGSGAEVVVAGELTITPEVLGDVRFRLHPDAGALRGVCEGFRGVTSDVVLRRTRAAPMKYVEEDLDYTSGDGHLKGTFLKPVGPGPFPTIVWTHGSGPDTRRTFYYAGRAHLMAQHGVASLIYDKRGAGESTGSLSGDLDVVIDDALAAVAAIKSRADVDTAAIGIAGFSQGGWIAPAVAARDRDVDFVVVGATPAITGGEQNLFSMVHRMRRDSVPETSVQDAERFVRRLYDFYQTGKDRAEVVAALEKAKSEPWFGNRWVQSVIAIPDGGLPEGRHPHWSPFSPDPLENWRRVRVPVLSMWGGDDIDVPVETSRSRIERTLTEAGNTRFRLEVFANASHGMWQNRDPDVSWDWPRQAPGAHELMVNWILEQTRH